MTKTALILGATGGIGSALALNLLARGWHVRGLSRRPGGLSDRIEWIQGDALKESDVVAAAKGASIIFHGVHPPGYRNWDLCIPMLENTIAAARASGARIIFPGTIYNYGPDAGLALHEKSPQNPLTRKGRVRVEMERMLEAVAIWGVRSLIVRAGDFFGARAPNSWFTAMIRGKRALYPGKPEISHAFAYLPDLAEAMARLIEIEDRLPAFDSFHFAGHDCGVAIAEATGLKVGAFPWAIVRLGALFNRTLYELLEIRYLWHLPIRLDNAKLRAAIGPEPRTDLTVAVAETLATIGI